MSISDVADVVMQLLGLSHRADNIVGNDMVRGISGGEKKRCDGLYFLFFPFGGVVFPFLFTLFVDWD